VSDAYKEIREGLSDFIDSVVVPLEDDNQQLFDNGRRFYDADGAYSPTLKHLLRYVREQASKAGYYTMFAPEDVGGGGCGAELLYAVWRHLHARYGPGRVLPFASVAHWSYGPSVLCSQLTSTAKERMLPDFMAGTTTSCFGMSEPNAGTDAWEMGTTARLDGDSWVINGTKQWITNAPEADWVFVWAVTDNEMRKQRAGGISCFLVPTSAPGFAVDSVIRLFGQAGGHEGIISFTDVCVPADAVVGSVDGGFALALAGVTTGRLYNCARCVGMAQWALDRSAEYVNVRSTFGRTIGEYQGVSFPLADCAIEIYAGDTMSRDCAARIDAGHTAHHQVAMAKVFTTEMCSRCYERCMQVHGGMGLTNEMRLYDGWHQARIVRIADGSAEILRRNVAKVVIGGRR